MMGRRLIEIVEVLVNHVHKSGYQLRAVEDDIYAEKEKRAAAEKDRDHWKTARQDAMQAGELMQAEIERLRQELSADAVRQELEELRAKNFELVEKLATVENAAATENENLRKQLAEARAANLECIGTMNAARAESIAARADNVEIRRRLNEEADRHRATNAEKIDLFQKLEWANKNAAELVAERDAALAAVSLQRAGIERLNAFVGKVRSVIDNDCDGLEIDEMVKALEELNAETEPTPKTEPAQPPKIDVDFDNAWKRRYGVSAYEQSTDKPEGGK